MARLFDDSRRKLISGISSLALFTAISFSGNAGAALLGDTLELPLIGFNSTGTTTYDAASDAFAIDASTLTILVPGNSPITIKPDGSGSNIVAINVIVDDAGALVGGVPGDDLVVTGEFIHPTLGLLSGVLLTGEVTGFGSADSGGMVDQFDFRFNLTSGLLAGDYPTGAVGVFVASENSDFVGDFTVDFGGGAKGQIGSIPGQLACNLEVDLLCRVEPQPTTMVGEKCSGKLQQFTVVWNGPGPVNIAAASGTTSTSGPINTGDEVTFFGPYGSNDVVVDISGAVSGQSKFHVSCSDDNFNSPDDCGKLAGNGKGDDSSLLNLWLLEGFIDANGDVLDCNPDDNGGEFSQSCSFTPPPAPSCDTLGKPASLTFKYTGGACPGANGQGSKADCSGAINGAEMAVISVNAGDNYTVSPTLVAFGDTFTVTRGGSDFRSNTDIDLSNSGGTQLNDIHTSCSAPLVVGDEFGAITLVAFDDQTGGADVTYKYVVTNNGDPLQNIDVTDIPFGFVGTIDALDTNEMDMLTRLATINGTTTNVAIASAALGGLECVASDTVIVEALGPPPCKVTPGEFKLEDNKIKWKLTNAGGDVATVESIELSAPDEFGSVKKVKLDGDIFKDDTRPMTWVFTAADFINDLKNRQIKVGDTKELLFETTTKFKHATADQISITVNFEEDCSVTFVPGAQTFVCSDAKPIDALSMIWNGPDGVDVMSPTGEMVSGVVNGQEVTFSGLSGMGNDIFWSVADAGAGVSGSSKFHVSCSDREMNGPEDCGGALGDGKDNNSSNINLWMFEGMQGSNGVGLDCSALL